ncbi:hypothetical protein [Nocardia sp. N2S4-5]|uniref:hypothetical protein n=1 Tax=Nocardia sp. N2S4-5 TaxID=3351565 RepID=UPI0037D4328C
MILIISLVAVLAAVTGAALFLPIQPSRHMPASDAAVNGSADTSKTRLPQRIPGSYGFARDPVSRPPGTVLARTAAAIEQWSEEDEAS